MTERVALYPGSFDPLTNGHLDILSRARRLADRLMPDVAASHQWGCHNSSEAHTRPNN